MTTKNPWRNTGSPLWRKRWDDGYKAGTHDYDNLKLTRIRDLERQVANLVEKNDNQRALIKTQDELLDKQGMGGYKAGHQAGLKAGQNIADSVIEAKEARAYGNGRTQGFVEGRAFGRDEGGTFDEGNEAGYTDGLAAARKQSIINSEDAYNRGMTDGRNMGLADWMRHFILYMQEQDHDFAVCNLTQLQEMRDAAAKIRQIVDTSQDVDPLLEEIEDILTRLEVVDR